MAEIDEEENYMEEEEVRGRSRRTKTADKKASRKARLAALKQGGLQFESDDEADDSLYHLVDEDEYKAVRQSRLEEDDFVVCDDDGDDMGYRDHGGELWDEEDFQGESAAAKKARKQSGTGPKRRVTKKVPKRRVNSLFTGGGKSERLGAAVVGFDKEHNIGNEDSFLADVMADDGDAMDMMQELTEDLQEGKERRRKKRKSNMTNAALFGSTTEARTAYLEGAVDTSPGTIGSSFAGSPGQLRRMMPQQRVQFNRTTPKRKADFDEEAEDNNTDNDMVDNDQIDSTTTVPKTPTSSSTTNTRASASESATTTTPKPTPATTPMSKPLVESSKKSKIRQVAMMTEEELEEMEEVSPDWQLVRREAVRPEKEEIKISSKELPMVDEEFDGETEKVLPFYWLDAIRGENAAAGTIFLFGKVYSPEAKTHVSCCLTVTGAERNVFALPREYKLDDQGNVTDEKVDAMMLYQELQQVLSKHGIKKNKTKQVERNYAFENPDVPRKAKWMKVKYDAIYPKLPSGLTGKTFSHMFGANVDPLERFLMKRDLMGPCWLSVRNATVSERGRSWCKLEADVTDPKSLIKPKKQDPAPKLVVISLKMQTILNRQTNSNEILAVSGLIHDQVECDGPTVDPEKNYSHFTAIRKCGQNPFPFDFKQKKHKNLSLCATERELISLLMIKIFKCDPDVIVGHNVLDFDLAVLLHRIKANTIPHWSRIGRMKKTAMPNLTTGSNGRATFVERTLAVGRMLVDVKVSAREFVKQTTYEMTELVNVQLGSQRVDLPIEKIPSMFGNSQTLLALCDHVERDSWFVMSLMFKLLILPLSKQITNITGGLLARTFAGGRSQRNEMLLCHEFHRLKFIVPDKPEFDNKKGAPKTSGNGDNDDNDGGGGGGTKKKKNKPQYSGGLVLEPKKGFYDKYILLLDFNSLYPSIIQEFNLCFTTVKRDHLIPDENGDIPMAEVPSEDLERGVLPKVIRTLIEKRKAVKKLIKDEQKLEFPSQAKLTDYDIRQKALKLTANSMYGCLGFTLSRFHAQGIAALITSKGREILQKTVDLAQNNLGLDVIYGDTDSIMINTRTTDFKETFKIGNQVKKEVNGLYKELELEIDGVFKTMLLLKKKKYAAITITERNGQIETARETKGLDMVRRDWSAISHDVGYHILNQILTMESRETLVEACHEYLRTMGQDITVDGKIKLEKFIIHRGLTKDPKLYADAKSQPHVQVALKMKADGKSVKANDTIPYIICNDGSNKPATGRAYHPDELRRNKELKPDIQYYLKNQLHPVVARLLDPIEGTDAGQIAECLGLDASQFTHTETSFDTSHSEIGMGMMKSQMSDVERYKSAEKFKVACKKCNTETTIEGVFDVTGAIPKCNLLCKNPGCSASFKSAYLCNKLTIAIRQYIDKYYTMRLVCDDISCPVAESGTFQISTCGNKCLDQYCRGTLRPSYSDSELYTQITYFRMLFDMTHAVKQLPEAIRQEGKDILGSYAKDYHAVHDHVEGVLDSCARKYVDLGNLFVRLKLHL